MSLDSAAQTLTEPFLAVRNVGKVFGSHQVLHDVNLEIAEGEVLVIIGPSGSGKSTLLRTINAIAPATHGSIVFRGHEWHSETPKHNPIAKMRHHRDLAGLRSEIGMVFQNFNVFPHMTALENVTLGLVKVRGLSKSEARTAGIQSLEQVGLGDKIDQYPARLSGGQKQRVALARALALKPKVMLFDEATSSLDPELVSGILDEMRRLAKAGMTMIVVTHEMGFAFQVAHRIAFMDQGSVIQVGTPEEIRQSTEPRLRAFLDSILV